MPDSTTPPLQEVATNQSAALIAAREAANAVSNHCNICDKDIQGAGQWTRHLIGRGHLNKAKLANAAVAKVERMTGATPSAPTASAVQPVQSAPVVPQTVTQRMGGEEGVYAEFVKVDHEHNDAQLGRKGGMFSAAELENPEQLCREWGGRGRYQVNVRARGAGGPIVTSRVVEVIDGESKDVKEQNVTTNATPWQMPQIPINPYTGQPLWPIGNPFAAAQPNNAEVESLKERLAAAERARERAEEKAQADAKENSIRAEIKALGDSFKDAIREIAKAQAPQKNMLVELTAALAPVIAGFQQSQAAAQTSQMALMTALISQDKVTPILTQIKDSQHAIAKEREAYEASRTEMFKLLANPPDKLDSMAKFAGAMGTMMQSQVATITTMIEKLGGEDEPWKEPLQNVVGALTSMVEAMAPALLAKQGIQMPGVTAPPPAAPEPAKLPEKAVNEQEQLGIKVLDLILGQFSSFQTALNAENQANGNEQLIEAAQDAQDEAADKAADALADYCRVCRAKFPGDADVQFFWGDPRGGVKRLLGRQLSQRGGDGAKFMDAIAEVIEDAINNAAAAASASATAANGNGAAQAVN